MTGANRPLQRWRHLVAGKLRRQVTFPMLIGLAQLIMASASLIRGEAPLLVVLWFVPALLLGFAIGRATRIVWDSEAYQVVVLGGQVTLSLAWLALQLGSRPALTRALGDLSFASSVTMVVVAGLVIGHATALLSRIRQALPRSS